MRTRIAIVGNALILGYSIRSIVAGAYFLAPISVVLAVLLVWLILRPTQPVPRSPR